MDQEGHELYLHGSNLELDLWFSMAGSKIQKKYKAIEILPSYDGWGFLEQAKAEEMDLTNVDDNCII